MYSRQRPCQIKEEKTMKQRLGALFALCLMLTLLMGLSLPTMAQMVYNEAPMLKSLVEEGLLPPVADRLPVPSDLVVEQPVEQVGQYGGTWRMMHDDPGMGSL